MPPRTLYFHSAPWCGSCKVTKPLAERLCAEHGVLFEEIDIEEHPDRAKVSGIMGVPTVALFSGDELVSLLAPNMVSAQTLRKALQPA